MAKHKKSKVTLGDLLTLVDKHCDGRWWDVVGVDIPGLDELMDSGEQADLDRASEIEADYLKAHMDDAYIVSWPEHVIVPQYNSDASYQRIKDDGSEWMTIYRSSLEEAIVEYLESVDRLQCHVHLRITWDGDCYVDSDAGYHISQAEYNKAPRHVRTVKHQQGHGQNHLPDDWMAEDDGIETVSIMFDDIVRELERSGLDVEIL